MAVLLSVLLVGERGARAPKWGSPSDISQVVIGGYYRYPDPTPIEKEKL